MPPTEFIKLCNELKLTFEQSIISTGLTDEMTGQLDLNAWIEKKQRMFIKSVVTEVTVKKSLLLGSWYFMYMDPTRLEEVLQFFDQLMLNGHAIYVPTRKGLKQAANLANLRSLLSSRHTPVPKELAWRLAASMNIKRDSIDVVDTNYLQNISARLNNKVNPEDFCAPLPKWLSEVELTRIEQLSEVDDRLALTIRHSATQHYPDYPKLGSRIHCLKLGREISSEDTSKLLTLLPNLHYLHLDSFDITEKKLAAYIAHPGLYGISMTIMTQWQSKKSLPDMLCASQLTHLTILDSSFFGETIFKILQASPRLTNLTLKNYSPQFYIPTDLRALRLEKLAVLNLDGNSQPDQIKSHLLAASPNLTTLSLKKEAQTQFYGKKNKLRKSRAAEWSKGNISSNSSGNILYTHSAEHLIIQHIRAGHVQSLEELHLSGSPVTADGLYEIAMSLPSLAKLALDGCPDLNNCLANLSQLIVARGHNPFKNLKECNLDNSDIDSEALRTLQFLAPNLNKLSFSDSSALPSPGDFIYTEKPQSNQLTHLDASAPFFQGELIDFRSSESKLCSLNLSTSSITWFNNLKRGQFLWLADLNLSSITTQTESEFGLIWAAAPNLLKLNLSYYVGKGKLRHLLPSSLKQGQLRQLDINNSRLSSRDLSALLAANPQLSILNISGCKFKARHRVNFDKISLPALSQLIASGAFLGIRLLDNLLKSAPGLKILDLYASKFEPDSCQLRIRQLNKLELLNLKDCNLSVINQLLLIKKSKQLLTLLPDKLNEPGLHQRAMLLTDSLQKLSCIKFVCKGATQQLIHLLNATPNLRELNIKNSQFDDIQPFNLKINQLSGLFLLNAKNSNLNLNQVISLIYAAPSLKWLNLEDCINIFSEDIQYLNNTFPDIQFKWRPSPFVSEASSSCVPVQPGSAFIMPPVPFLAPYGQFQHDPHTTYTVHMLFTGHPGAVIIPAEHYHMTTRRWDRQKKALALYQPDERKSIKLMPANESPGELKFIFSNNPNIDQYFLQIEYENLTPNLWHQLPATSTCDQLSAFSSSMAQDEIELLYDQEQTGYYFFRPLKQQNRPTLVTGIIHAGYGKDNYQSEEAPKSKYISLINQLHFKKNGQLTNNSAYRALRRLPAAKLTAALYAFCQFEHESAANIKGGMIESLNHSLTHRAGSCFYRALLFTVIAAEFGLISSFYEDNECHAFALITHHTGYRQKLDFGGAETMIEILAAKPTTIEDYAKAPKKIRPQDLLWSRIPEPAADNPFVIWNNNPLHSNDTLSLTAQTLERSLCLDRQLLLTEDLESIEALFEALAWHATESCFYTFSLDDISLTSTRVSSGVSIKIPGALEIFIRQAQQHAHTPYTWFINWSDAKNRHNSLNSILVAEHRHIGKRKLPDNLHLVIIMDRGSHKKMGDEFRSRLTHVSHLPKLKAKDMPVVTDLPITDQDILLDAPEAWAHELTGQFTLEGRIPVARSGALIKALEAGASSLIIHNPPLHDAGFRVKMRFLQKTGSFYFNGNNYSLPPCFQLVFSSPTYDFPLTAFISPATSSSSSQSVCCVLNQATYQSFFMRNKADKNGVSSFPNLLEYYQSDNPLQKQIIRLIVTDNMSEAQWFKLAQKAEQYHVHLIPCPVPGINLPEKLQRFKRPGIKLMNHTPASLVVCKDVNYALSKTDKADEPPVPIGPDTTFESLFVRLHRNKSGQITGRETDLLKAIKRGRSVVLKGIFSKELIQKLQSLFVHPSALIVNGEHIQNPDITLIARNNDYLGGMTWEQIDYHPKTDLTKLTESARKKLQTCYRHLGIEPRHSHFIHYPTSPILQKEWVSRLRDSFRVTVGKAPRHSESRSSSFSHHTGWIGSPAELLRSLEQEPFVFLFSKSGEGKSHLMQKALPEYAKTNGYSLTVHHTMAEVKKWVACKGGLQILFIDEANLSTANYHIFDNLARGEGVIWLDGQKLKLTKHHKIVFAGNPYNYNGRIQADLFHDFPHNRAFKAKPLSLILADSLKRFDDPDAALSLIEQSYQQALAARVNITPRNALAICHQALDHKFRFPHLPEKHLLQYAIRSSLKALHADKKAVKPLRSALNPHKILTTVKGELQGLLQNILPKMSSNGFIWTPSRQKIAQAMLTLLDIRERKIQGDFEQDQGINALLLEGVQGLGKSDLVKTLLKEKGIIAVIINLADAEKAEKKLIKAFHNGDVVIIDELNSLANERLLNDLLSGIDPDKKPPRKPGFCVFATQNPASFQQKESMSPAQENRFMTLELSKYTVEELQQILIQKYQYSEQLTVQRLKEHKHARRYAKQEGLFGPDTRTLFNQAKKDQSAFQTPDLVISSQSSV